MAELEILTAENGVAEPASDVITEDNITEAMSNEYKDGKGGED